MCWDSRSQAFIHHFPNSVTDLSGSAGLVFGFHVCVSLTTVPLIKLFLLLKTLLLSQLHWSNF